jgi:biopolymer transport protein ExbD
MPAAKPTPQKLDVWLTEANKVYREVPYDVVADWVRQSRLLGDDRVRPSRGKDDWQLLADSALAVYLPRPEPPQAEDVAEALEPVEAGLQWRRPKPETDEDVDMIPLIDVSLVLLIFFMLVDVGNPNAAPGGNLPQIETGEQTERPEGLWIRVDLDRKSKTPVYSVGRFRSENELERYRREQAGGVGGPTGDVNVALTNLETLVAAAGLPPIEVTINAEADLDAEVVRKLLVRIESNPKLRGKVRTYTGGNRKGS